METPDFEVKFFENRDNMDFYSGKTLIVAPATVGNVGQLATDLMLTNLSGLLRMRKSGRIFHPALESVVGFDQLSQLNSGKSHNGCLITSCEIYEGVWSGPTKYVVVLFRAPVGMKGRKEFVDDFGSWIISRKFEQVICLSSIEAADRTDQQLDGTPFRYLATNTSDDLTWQFDASDWKPIEKRVFPAPAVIDGVTENTEGVLHLPGGGITESLYDTCKIKNIPFLALIMFASDGDNTPEALTLYEKVDEILKFRVNPKQPDQVLSPIKMPTSWRHFREISKMCDIY